MNRFKPYAPALLAAAASGLAMALSMGLAGEVSPGAGWLWLVALAGPLPVLWFAYKTGRGWIAFLAALAAAVIGNGGVLSAYAGRLPATDLLLAISLPALGFALSVAASRFIRQRITPITAVAAFAFFWTGFDYLLSLGPNGAVASPAYAQLGMPWMIQGASLFGMWAITFVVALIAAAAAMAAATRQIALALVAAGVLALNLGFGAWRIATAPHTTITRVGLAADDSLIGLRFKADAHSALQVAKAYAAAGREMARQGARLIVFPERLAVLTPAWRDAVDGELRALAKDTHSVVVAGFEDRGAIRRNVADVFFAHGEAPLIYAKRHLVPGLESAFTPGKASFMSLSDATGVAICKDMDFPAMLRADSQFGATLFAVPAWDFGQDGPWHARLAILRGVENGFAVVRAANDGLLAVSDAYGRVIAAKASPGGMVRLVADVPRGPGHTPYAENGDGLAWISAAMSLLLLAVAVAARPKSETPAISAGP